MQTRLARLVIEGNCVLFPQWLQFPLRITEADDAPVELGRFLATQHAMRIRQPGFELNIGSWRVDIGLIQLQSPRVDFAKPGSLLRLLETGTLDGELATLDPAVRAPWRLTRLTDYDMDQPLVPAPWNTVGVDERPALQQVQTGASRTELSWPTSLPGSPRCAPR